MDGTQAARVDFFLQFVAQKVFLPTVGFLALVEQLNHAVSFCRCGNHGEYGGIDGVMGVFAAVFLFVGALHSQYFSEIGGNTALLHINTREYGFQIVESVFGYDSCVDQLAVTETLAGFVALYIESAKFCLPVVKFEFPKVLLTDTLVFALNGGCRACIPFPKFDLCFDMLYSVFPRFDAVKDIGIVGEFRWYAVVLVAVCLGETHCPVG